MSIKNVSLTVCETCGTTTKDRVELLEAPGWYTVWNGSEERINSYDLCSTNCLRIFATLLDRVSV